ncbi:DNA-binding PucR family transcriptional regulator [Actinomadura cellulosilytica]|uniref:DNA-binding PucR family transcriptional regulator n=1 Tax=Thermomonospora cellulosilytica TaxID=1411118 RepID=A0A7W3R9C8_9ACTN|nr:DNA-binding PucR family transcriptional regulator [Thermomonospora cellulosilytica]
MLGELAAVPRRASRDADGAPEVFLDGYVELLADVSLTGRRISRTEADDRRAWGAKAAEQGLPLRAIVDLYLSATWLAWPLLPGVRRAAGMAELRSIGEAVFRAADAATVALADGYDAAQRLSIRQEEAQRREFIDDLLYGRGDLGRLAERAARYGLRLASAHVVAVARGRRPFLAEDPVMRRIEAVLISRFSAQEVLLATREGLLVCLAPAAREQVIEEFVRQVEAVLGADAAWRVGLGRAHADPGGVVRSFDEARTAVGLADRLGLGGRVFRAADLLVFQVLMRDTAAISDLVDTVLGPLRTARGGAGPLLDTLEAYFRCNRVAAATARRLHIGVRTVSYRLERVRRLTGYSVEDSVQRYTLETAVLGAHLLGWPEAEPARRRG